MGAPEAEDPHGGQHAESKDGKEVAHYSSTSSMCWLPAPSSSLRVMVSEYFGSSHSITMKNLSWVTCEKRRCLSSGWCRRGSRFRKSIPSTAPNAPSKIVSSKHGTKG